MSGECKTETAGVERDCTGAGDCGGGPDGGAGTGGLLMMICLDMLAIVRISEWEALTVCRLNNVLCLKIYCARHGKQTRSARSPKCAFI